MKVRFRIWGGAASTRCARVRRGGLVRASGNEAAPAVTNSASTNTDAPAQTSALEQRAREVYTMSQLFVKNRPEPIPLDEFERRRKKRELDELADAGKRRGLSRDTIAENLELVEMLLPGIMNLHKAKAADWLTIITDVNGLMTKLFALKEAFPKANLQKVLQQQPKLLLKSTAALQEEAQQVLQILAAAPEPDAIIEAVPSLLNPTDLVRALAQLKTAFPGTDPVELLSKHPDIVLNLGEANIEDSAEYGELSTKD